MRGERNLAGEQGSRGEGENRLLSFFSSAPLRLRSSAQNPLPLSPSLLESPYPLHLDMPNRCAWVTDDPLYLAYHDTEWGVPVYDERELFEFLVLETFQAGLSWLTVLKKRENFRKAFDHFEVEKVANYGEAKIQALLDDPGIIRNKLKVGSTVSNAQAFLNVQEEFGSFDRYSWGFVGGKPNVNHWRSLADVPATTSESEAFSRDLKARGFKFVGPTVVYAFMQATGQVMDHTTDCFRYAELAGE